RTVAVAGVVALDRGDHRVGVQIGAVGELHPVAQGQGPLGVVVVGLERVGQFRGELARFDVVLHQHVVDQGQRLAAGAAAGTGGDVVERVDQKLGAGDQGAAADRVPVVALLVDQADPVAVDGFGGAGRPAGVGR